MTALTKAGRYEIVGELGRGAMGVVYKAVDPVIGRTVAVKTIRLTEEGTGMSRPELLQRFQTEAHAAGLLTHPNIVVVYDAGEEDGLYYITMELVEGKSLQTLLDARQAFPLPRVVRIMEQTCGALQFAHERNIVHRDIKPANLMLTPDDTVKVTDFGTAKILQFGTAHQTAHVIGTPSYMSPEQVKGRPVDGRSDIFSLGVVLYEMVTGEKPFPGQNITTVIYKIVNEDPVPPRQIDPSIHPGLSQTVMKALAKQPEARYQTCREMLEDLKDYRSLATGAEATVVLPGPGNTSVAPTRQNDAGWPPAAGSLAAPAVRRTGSMAPLQPERKKSRAASAVLALLLMAIIGYCGYRLKPYMQDLWQRVRAPQDSTGEIAAQPVRAAEHQANSAQGDGGSSEDAAESEGASGSAGALSHPVSSAKTGSGGHAHPGISTAPTKSAPEPKQSDPGLSVAAALPASTAAAGSGGHPKTGTSSTPTKTAPEPKKTEGGLSLATAEFRARIEQALQDTGLAGRVKLEGTGSTLTFSGKLKPGEHRELLKRLRAAPESVRIVDHIEYEDAPAENTNGDERLGDHPVPRAGFGGIHVVTDVIGATAVLRGPRGRALNQCQTPCSFNDLFPAPYSLEVQKDGYRPVQTALRVTSGNVLEPRISLESMAMGLLVNTTPAGAEVYIDGAKQSGETPVTLPLAPGDYSILIRKEGFEAYAGHIQVKSNSQTPLSVELTAKSEHVAWVTVQSEPVGAIILVDGAATGQITPARVQMTAGMHTVTLQHPGYAPLTRRVLVDEGQTVRVLEAMKRN